MEINHENIKANNFTELSSYLFSQIDHSTKKQIQNWWNLWILKLDQITLFIFQSLFFDICILGRIYRKSPLNKRIKRINFRFPFFFKKKNF
jgi:hypothetical protein